MDTRLIQLGILLFLLGLLTGFTVSQLKNPRMGLTSHLEGVMNGMFLVIVGLIWSRIDLPHAWLTVTFWLVVFGTYANWLATLLAAAWGARTLMPIAAGSHQSTPGRERVIGTLILSVASTTVAACVLILIGLF